MKHFHGVNLSWSVSESILEVKLHRGPCNEIGTTTLRELEQLAAFVKDGAGGARAMITWSDRKAGFCAGADLRQLHEGMIGAPTVGIRELRKLRKYLPTALTRTDEGGSVVQSLSQAAIETAERGGWSLYTPFIVRRVRKFLDRIHAVFDTLDTAPITTIAAVHGVVFGGGFELALTSDLIVADRSARFAFPELRLGIVPGFGGIPRLERDVGNAVVRDLLLTGRSLGAKRAHALGLVSQVVGRGDHLEVARRLARQATRFDPETVARGKAFAKPLPRARLDEEKELFLRMLRSPVVFQALDRFVHSQEVRPYLS